MTTEGSAVREAATRPRRTSHGRGPRAFPDRASALRLITAVALQATVIWTDRRYLDMNLMPSREAEVAKAA